MLVGLLQYIFAEKKINLCYEIFQLYMEMRSVRLWQSEVYRPQLVKWYYNKNEVFAV